MANEWERGKTEEMEIYEDISPVEPNIETVMSEVNISPMKFDIPPMQTPPMENVEMIQSGYDEIKQQREENKNNMNYPEVYWIGSNLLRVSIGDKTYKLSPTEALDMFHDNELFMNEFRHLIGPEMFEDLISKKENIINYDKIKHEKEKQKEIDDKLQDIIMELDLTDNLTDSYDQLRACCKVQEYIVKHNIYTSNILSEKENGNFGVIDDLYAAVIENQSICSSNSLEFQAILSRIGITVENVILEDNQTKATHMSNIVELGGFYYFFDSTLDQSIFLQHAKEGQELILCCAGLGVQEYTEFYTPIGIFRDKFPELLPIPNNMAQSRIPQEIVNNLVEENRQKR